jgi:uncharacterized protein Yka (UPF0111/DUF47 family)
MAFSLFGFDLSGILTRIKTFLGPFGKLIDSLKESYDHLVNIFNAAEKLTNSIISEVDAWRNFKQDIRFSQRVIQIERAVQKTRDLIEGIPAAWHSIVDLIKQVKNQIGGGESPVEEAETIAEDVESGGIKNLLEKFPALGKALEKILGVLAILIQALSAISDSIDDVQQIVDEITRLRLEIEKLDTIFLSQSNKRKTLKLADGRSIKIRVGKLHASA